MTASPPRKPLPRTPNRLEAIPGQSAADEQLLAMILALTSELAIVRARLDTCERLLTGAGVFPPGAIDAFDPSPQDQAEREALRKRTLTKVMRPIQEQAQRDLAMIAASHADKEHAG